MLACQTDNLGPALHQRVVRQRVRGALLTLTECVKAVGEFTRDLRLSPELRHELSCCGLAALFACSAELMHHLPRRDASIGRRVPIGGHLLRPEQSDFPPRGGEDAGSLHPVYAGVLALGELLGTTEVTIREAVLFEPGDGPAAVGVE